jgi:transcriptional regulator with XRE-family HTH domain
LNFRDHLKQQMATDPEFRREWEADEPAFQVVRAIVGARARLGWTQTELAQRMGTTQANISRAETTGRVSPEFLARFAQAVGGSARMRLELPGSRTVLVDVIAMERKSPGTKLPEPVAGLVPLEPRTSTDEPDRTAIYRDAVASLADVMQHDRNWGVRRQASLSLCQLMRQFISESLDQPRQAVEAALEKEENQQVTETLETVQNLLKASLVPEPTGYQDDAGQLDQSEESKPESTSRPGSQRTRPGPFPEYVPRRTRGGIPQDIPWTEYVQRVLKPYYAAWRANQDTSGGHPN